MPNLSSHLLFMSLLLLTIQGGHTSGSTQVTQIGEYYSLTLSTPSMSFATEPETGHSPEQQYHADAKKRFENVLGQDRRQIEEKVEQLRQKFKGRMTILPFKGQSPIWNEYTDKNELSSGPVRVAFPVSFPEMGELELIFERPPTKALYEEVREKIRVLFQNADYVRE